MHGPNLAATSDGVTPGLQNLGGGVSKLDKVLPVDIVSRKCVVRSGTLVLQA